MARQRAPIEVNTFVQGLITEATPLTFPENASLDEDNFELLRNGSRRRRLGLDMEDGWRSVSSGQNNSGAGRLALSTYNWENAGGSSNKELIVIQVGRALIVFDTDISPLSSGEVYRSTIPNADPTQVFSFTVVDGILVCATGKEEIYRFIYSNGSIQRFSNRLLIRDTFGVEDKFEGRSIRDGNLVNFRPTALNFGHRYNLRNQSWAYPRDDGAVSDARSIGDPIKLFFDVAGKFPANSDTVIAALYPDPSNEENRTGDQFFAEDLRDNPLGTTHAASGHFIIDALRRGSSRLESVNDLYNANPELVYPITSLPADRTPGGALCVTEFAGRVWYAGFSGEVIDGDEESPKMSSYLLYSQLVQDPSDITNCYQDGDPTSKDSPDLLDTDGGHLRIDGAYRIQRLINVGSSLIVIAENGLWTISGGSDYGFTANNIKISKISDKGCDSPGSVVEIESTIMMWADDAIYHIKQNEYGDWVSDNLTRNTIQSFYEDIRPVDKLYAQGAYDSYQGKVRWVYQNSPEDSRPSRELILDVELGAFYTNTIKSPVNASVPKTAAPVSLPAFRLFSSQEGVTVQGAPVTVGGSEVTAQVATRGAGFQELAYMIVTSVNPLRFSFGLYKDTEFKDFKFVDGVGIDAEAHLVTGWLSGGDYQRVKSVPYIQFYFNRTENGFEDDGTGNLFPTMESSCIVQAQWNWTNSPKANRWGREFEAYRYRRLYSPSGAGDEFDSGDAVIQTKNKLRGSGKVLSIYARTSPGKDCQLLGWSMIIGVNGNV